ncbi:MAG: Electron transport protein [Rhodospirillaceae bacterium]|nr:MAG: Electron transport protein [Rhodospirillaceae bacterium]TNC96214.1 MAG: Electron transport protein SCO1/SenC [Stygiobacter sp.]
MKLGSLILAGALAVMTLPGPLSPALAQEFSGRFLLETHDGKRVNDDSFKGKVRMMAFGYTFCPDVCPTALSAMAAALDLLGPQRAAEVVPLFVTVDPKRDTKAQLKDYMSAFGPSFIGLTGTVQMTDAAARSFRVRYEIHQPADKDSEHYVVDHSAGIFIMDRNGGFAAKLGHTASAEDVADRLRQVIDGESK